MRYEWGPWIEHDGSGCPVVGYFAHVRLAVEPGFFSPGRIPDDDRMGYRGIASISPSWFWQGSDGVNVVRYRVRRPLVSEWLAETTSDLPVTEDA
jgi:hypothetical protein